MDTIGWYLDNGTDPSVATLRGYTALDFACYQSLFDTVKLLVDHSADVSSTAAIHCIVANSSKCTILKIERLGVVAYLLERGADVNQLESIDEGFERAPTTGCRV